MTLGEDNKDTSNRATLEHVIPKSKQKGVPFNLVVACLSCNHERGNKDFAEFLIKKLKLRMENPKNG